MIGISAYFETISGIGSQLKKNFMVFLERCLTFAKSRSIFDIQCIRPTAIFLEMCIINSHILVKFTFQFTVKSFSFRYSIAIITELTFFDQNMLTKQFPSSFFLFFSCCPVFFSIFGFLIWRKVVVGSGLVYLLVVSTSHLL